MKIRKLVFAWFLSFVVMFLLGGFWHEMLLGDFYETNTKALAREEVKMPFVALGVLVLALLMAYAYPIGYKGGSPVMEGLRFGMLIGLIWTLPSSLILHGVWKCPLHVLLVDSAWQVVEQGIGGIIIGLMYGRPK